MSKVTTIILSGDSDRRASLIAERGRPTFGAKLKGRRRKMFHVFHSLQSDMAFGVKNSFSWIFNAVSNVRYIKIFTWLRGFQDKLLRLVVFSLYPSLFWALKNKRKTLKKKWQFWPESLGSILEYWYLERGLLTCIWRQDSTVFPACRILTV